MYPLYARNIHGVCKPAPPTQYIGFGCFQTAGNGGAKPLSGVGARWKCCPRRFQALLARLPTLVPPHPPLSIPPHPQPFSARRVCSQFLPHTLGGGPVPAARRGRRVLALWCCPSWERPGAGCESSAQAVSAEKCRDAALPPSLPPSAHLPRRGWRAGAVGPPSWTRPPQHRTWGPARPPCAATLRLIPASARSPPGLLPRHFLPQTVVF